MAVRILQAVSPEQWQAARTLVEEYAASLGVDLSFQDFAHEIEQLTREYGPPDGAFLLAEDDGDYLGCVALRRFEGRAGEIKRLYVRPAGRGRGLGRTLANTVIAAGRERGYERLLLDTLPSMSEARALYQALGFRETTPYRFNPIAGTAFLELRLES
jgi:ribosomal protein S18 acetylase RimI-like enzyme